MCDIQLHVFKNRTDTTPHKTFLIKENENELHKELSTTTEGSIHRISFPAPPLTEMCVLSSLVTSINTGIDKEITDICVQVLLH